MRISTTSEGWKIRRLKKWPNGSGRNCSLNVPGCARSPCTKHRQRGASIAASKKPAVRLQVGLFKRSWPTAVFVNRFLDFTHQTAGFAERSDYAWIRFFVFVGKAA